MSSEEPVWYVREEEADLYEFRAMYAYYKFTNLLILMRNRCLKYHISSNVESAPIVAEITLPYLRKCKIYHKVVTSRKWLIEQTSGEIAHQKGKFITIYMPVDSIYTPFRSELRVEKRNPVTEKLHCMLLSAAYAKGISSGPQPSRRITNKSGDTPPLGNEEPVFLAPPDRCFIYGGFECDPEK